MQWGHQCSCILPKPTGGLQHRYSISVVLSSVRIFVSLSIHFLSFYLLTCLPFYPFCLSINLSFFVFLPISLWCFSIILFLNLPPYHVFLPFWFFYLLPFFIFLLPCYVYQSFLFSYLLPCNISPSKVFLPISLWCFSILLIFESITV